MRSRRDREEGRGDRVVVEERLEKKQEDRRLEEIKAQLAAKEEENAALTASWEYEGELRVG